MEIYNATAKTKSGQLRVKKGIGSLLIKSSQLFSGLTNETISMYIERASGNNQHIATKIPLNAFIATSTYGDEQGYVYQGAADFSAICEIAEDGAIRMTENETLVIELDGLKSAQTYEIHGIELPVRTDDVLFFEEKVMLPNEKIRKFDVSNYDEAFFIGDFTKIYCRYQTNEGISTVEYTQEEFKAVHNDAGLVIAGATQPIDQIVASLIYCVEIEIHSVNQVNVILRDTDKNLR